MNSTMTSNTTFTPEQIRGIRADLAKLRPAKPTRPKADGPMTIKDAIMQLAPTLVKMRDKGFSTAELVDHLGARGIAIKPATLSRYLHAHQTGAQGKAARAEPADSAKPVQTPPQNTTDAKQEERL